MPSSKTAGDNNMANILAHELDLGRQFLSNSKAGNVVRQVLAFNVIILCLIIIGKYSELSAFIGGAMILLLFSFLALTNSRKTVFLIFGTKFTFDALWYVGLDMIDMPFRLLELSVIPVIILLVPGILIRKGSMKLPMLASFSYLLWVTAAMALNEDTFSVNFIVRQSGLFFGLMIGRQFLRDEESLVTLFQIIFVSTLIPIFAACVQIVASHAGVLIMNFTRDSVREYRAAGFYYDAATAGMVSIASLVSNSYLIYSGNVNKRYRLVHLLYLPLNILVVLAGGTRSIIGVSILILLVFFIRNLKTAVKLFPIIVVIIFLSLPYLDKAINKTTTEFQQKVDLMELLTEKEYRTMLTGRISVWQDIWFKFNEGSFLQQLFGSGVSSNAHSSYFFLLLQIGWLGLLFYLLFHALLIRRLLALKLPQRQKTMVLVSLIALLLIGISASTVTYTSFQWIIYMIVGGALNMETLLSRPKAAIRERIPPYNYPYR